MKKEVKKEVKSNTKYENLIPGYYYKVRYMGDWRLGHVVKHEGHKYFYILEESINVDADDIFLEEYYPFFRMGRETGEVSFYVGVMK